MEAISKWRQYLLGRAFVVRTDQKSIKELLQQTIHTPEQQRYVRKLLGYDFVIEYKPGKLNVAADGLSRMYEAESVVECDQFNALIASRPIPEFLEALRKENEALEDLKELQKKILLGREETEYKLVNGLVLHKGRYFLGGGSKLKQHLIKEFHSTPTAGHGGVKRALVRLSNTFYWIGMRKDVEQFVENCTICQQTKYQTSAPAGLLQPLPIPTMVWNELSMDFITQLPSSRGFTVIFVVVDRLTKTAHFGALPMNYTAEKVAHLFISMVVKIHGFPQTVVSDRDTAFLSKFWNELFRLSGTNLKYSTAYHPQTDGQTEVTNRGIEQYLRSFVHEKPSGWYDFLPWAEYSYNTSYHSGLRMSHFQALFGRLPQEIPAYTPQTSRVEAVEELLLERDALLKTLRENLRQAQLRMENQANQKRREVEFEIGERVWLKLQPYRQHTMKKRASQKLALRYFGPYEVIERIGKVAYKLKLPAEAKIHPVFHVSLLKPCRGELEEVLAHLPEVFVEHQPKHIPEAVCGRRVVTVSGKPTEQILIQWQGWGREDATWEDVGEFCKDFPQYRLEDKEVLEEVGNVIPAEVVEGEQGSVERGDASSVVDLPSEPEVPHVVQLRRSSRARMLPAKLRD